MENCIFCKIIKREVPAEIIHESEHFISFLDLHPNNYGHSLVVPKEHVENIYEIKGDTSINLGEELSKISKAVKKAVNADGINIFMNNDPAAGQIIFHQHSHVIPRYENDNLHHWPHKTYGAPEDMKEIAEKIRNSITS